MRKILIVDDQPEIRRLLNFTLGSDYEVVDAIDGMSALEAVRLHRPQAMLLDIMMPGEIDGLEVLRRIKSDPACGDIFVALVTARGQKSDYHLGMELGADAYFIKPFSPSQVVQWLREKLP